MPFIGSSFTFPEHFGLQNRYSKRFYFLTVSSIYVYGLLGETVEPQNI